MKLCERCKDMEATKRMAFGELHSEVVDKEEVADIHEYEDWMLCDGCAARAYGAFADWVYERKVWSW